MKLKPPSTRRKFANALDEINYRYDKLLYWLYQREDANRADPYAKRLAKLLSQAYPDHDGIFGEECWSLVYESRGDLSRAIQHRENEIRLIRRLHDISRNSPSEDVALEHYGYTDLSDRLDLLATLYRDAGNLDKAIAVLRESKQLCKTHGIEFDGEDLLQEYLAEKRHCSASNANGKNGRHG